MNKKNIYNFLAELPVYLLVIAAFILLLINGGWEFLLILVLTLLFVFVVFLWVTFWLKKAHEVKVQ